MKLKRMAPVAAIACGALCALCVFAYTQSVRGEADAARAEALARYGGEQVEVCVARRDIATGEKVDSSAVEMRLWVADLLPEGALRSSGEAVGRTATAPIVAGEVLVAKRFEQREASLEVPAGLVALSVSAKAVQAVGGAVQPGMKVDLYASGEAGAAAVARGVSVLATSASASEGGEAADMAWVTLALDPESVQEVIAASRKTELYFALPADGDALTAQEEGGAADVGGAAGEDGGSSARMGQGEGGGA